MKRLVMLGCILLTSVSLAGTQLDIAIGDTVQAKLNTDQGEQNMVNPLVGGLGIKIGDTHLGYGGPNDKGDGIWAGCYVIDIEGIVQDYKSFCMDIFSAAGLEYTTHTAYEATTDFEAMWGTYYYSVVNSDLKAAAFQLAVWEMIHETGSYDISQGHFYIDSLNPDSPNNNGASIEELISLANMYLDSNSWTASVKLAMLDDDTHQPYLVEILPKVYLDIKPGSCPNPINLKQKGVLPVAVLSTEHFDIENIDPATIRLIKEGVDGEVEPIRWNYEDVASPFKGQLCRCWQRNGDGYIDMTLKFETQQVVRMLKLHDNVGQTIPLTLIAFLNDGTMIEAKDCVRIIHKGQVDRKKRAPSNKRRVQEDRVSKKGR